MKHIKQYGAFKAVTARYDTLVSVQETRNGAHRPRVITLEDATIRAIVQYRKVRTMDEPTPAEILDPE
jgi:hypothetical protein